MSNTIEELLEEWGRPEGPCPPAPPWHVESTGAHGCHYGAISYEDPPVWVLCDCEDPAHPWPARVPGDGPRDCGCFGCNDHEPRSERGKIANCEHKDHHCIFCHERSLCTIPECGFWKL
jgi:hypothetical protein